MQKTKLFFNQIKDAFTLICFRIFDKHFQTLQDYDDAGITAGTELAGAVKSSIDVVGESLPDDYKERLFYNVKKGFNR